MPAAESVRPAAAAAAKPAAKVERPAAEAAHGERNGAAQADNSVRVRTDRLDRLVDMVGELVIAQSMVAQDESLRAGGRHEMIKKVSHAGKIIRELQDLSMSLRMVPLKAAFQKAARVVRDTARKIGKTVVFESDGEDVELDRNMVDLIADPLVHMVRNSVDHGIERPEARREAGKSETGRIRLEAFHSGGNVVVRLSDDGHGLDRARILKKALEKGLIRSDVGLTDVEVFNLIFEPGFSTSEKITDVSGRGVGMDVVRRAVESLKGRIDIESVTGKGSSFSLHLPLTLAITDGMLVRVGDQRYLIPTVNMHQSFRPTADMIATIGGKGELVMLRGEPLPLFRLHRLFHVAGARTNPTDALVVVVGGPEGRAAILVDELLEQRQVVAKSLGEGLPKIQGISGGAVLGDGTVGLILDPAGVLALAAAEKTEPRAALAGV
jgi:two-component system chemotaxis sensor kinase CheA